ncbi:glycosyltransferase [Paraburkholderia sp. DHOC27]|uniref:glycosyltransferase n=1 Tax=Paraburkholderia sp. DHOC27 TaxID=2303330 RepID=UPI000E3D8164|nr:glycosyltransferase [Paraburkholderia sp. DHOC27]RFU47905.1 glycosyltransferase [Paraburkholderia sp. DHOC27]
MRISVAMATYNGALYIRQQLDSLADQTVLPHELVVTDDGSTDDTLAVVEAFAKHAPFPVRIHRNPERLNHAENFLRAASLCRGDWIAYCDQDDVWLKHKIEEVVHLASRPGVSMVVHAFQTVDADLHAIRGSAGQSRVKRGSGPNRFPPLGYFPGLCITFDAALLPLLLSKPRFPDAHNLRYPAGHDKWTSSVADAVGTVRYARKTLLLYRQHGANTCGASDDSMGHQWRQSSATGASSYRAGAALAAQYSETFERLAASEAGARWQERLYKAANRYQRTRRYLLARAALYEAGNLPARLALFAKLSLTGSYRFNPLRQPLHAFAKDLYFVVSHPFGRRNDDPTAGSSIDRDTAPLEHKS